MGIGVLLPKTLTQAETDLCWQILGEIEELRMAWGKWTVSITDAEEHRRTLRQETWTQPHTTWSTVTPFVFDHHPKKDPFGPEAEQGVRRSLGYVGLNPAEISLHSNPWHSGVPVSSAFQPAPARAGKPQRYHCHVRVRFERPVAGPIVAGAGQYYGYGLFRGER
jgi:CRISPR-associated protein Csb2